MEATLHRDLYLQPSWFAKEREGIFFHDWACVGRENDFLDKGDFKLIDLAGESILLVRGDDLKLRAFFNVCRHRGCQLIDSAKSDGRTGSFKANIRCPYHSWTYRLDGGLHHAPHMDVEKEKYPLHQVPLDSWGGFVFLQVRPSNTTLAEQLGAIATRTARYPLAGLECSKRIHYTVAAYWKVILENYNECYHCAGVHPELC
jgi:Rieske 2Fe-2S family protein